MTHFEKPPQVGGFCFSVVEAAPERSVLVSRPVSRKRSVCGLRTRVLARTPAEVFEPDFAQPA